MTILLFGTTGQVGWELGRALSPLDRLVVLGRADADFSRPDELAGIVASARPRVIVNAVAYTAVDRAEAEPALADAVNHQAVAALARAAREAGSLLVHYSTDYVFGGTGSEPHAESDPTAPQSVYGASKLAGEMAIRASGCRHLIFRTSWVHASRGRNFVRTILRLAGEQERLTVVNDQHGAPTSAELIADVTALALARPDGDALPEGTYHLAAGGVASWYDFARLIMDEARRMGHPVKPGLELVPIPASAYPVPALRPANSRLATAKLETALGITLPDWRYHAQRTLRELVEGPQH